MNTKLAASQLDSVARRDRLFVSVELGNAKWHVAAGDGGTRVSEYTVNAGDGPGLLAVIERARNRFGLSKDAPVVSCYETAGSSQAGSAWDRVPIARAISTTTKGSARRAIAGCAR